MTLTIIIFFIAIVGAFGMLMFRSWEIQNNKIEIEENKEKHLGELSFRYIESVFLHTIKHIVQWIVLSIVKLWFIITTKSSIWLQNKLPKLNKLFKKKETNGTDSRKISFVERAVIESKIKIRKVKEKIKQDHAEEVKILEEEIKVQEEKVDKIL
ncbi:MAG: hypothetical protein WC241_03375 [Candidatus Paceibacterota bacterium]|jgi:hypothetical protein